ncbi:MAG: hypothetical protein WCA38_20295 [Candidatus Acidiferrales bacterium]
MKKRTTAVMVLAALLIPAGLQAQEDPLIVKGGHRLGETVDQFFSEGREKDVLAACLPSALKGVDRSTKHKAKEICEDLNDTRKQATSGKHTELKPTPETKDQLADTFTFEGGHLVKVELIYTAPNIQNNYKGRMFEDISAAMKRSYGPPKIDENKETQDAYGVPYAAHREMWLTPQAAILLTDQPGQRATTTIVAFTRAEYDRTMDGFNPKITNPLQ